MAEREGSSRTTPGNQGNDEVPGQVITRFCQPCSKNCKETEASVFWSTCNEFQCKDCSNAHNIYTFMQNHKLVDASAAPERTTVFDMNGSDRCSKHGKLVKFFCDDDKKLCCSTCTITEHRKCYHLDEIKNLDIDKNSINKLKVNIKYLKQRNEAAAKQWTDSEIHIQEQAIKLLKQLDAVRTSVNSRLDDFEKDNKIQMASTSEKKADEYNYSGAQCKDAVTHLEHDMKTLNTVRLQRQTEQLFIVYQRINEPFEAMNEKYSQLLKLQDTEMSIEPNHELAQIVGTNIKLGFIKINTMK